MDREGVEYLKKGMPGYSNDEVSSMPDNDRTGHIHDIEILRAFMILLGPFSPLQ